MSEAVSNGGVDALAGRLIGGLVRYVMLITLGLVSTLTFFCSLIATFAAVGAGQGANVQDPATYAIGVIAIMCLTTGVSLMRWVSLDLPDFVLRVISGIKQQMMLIIFAIGSICILLFL